MKKPPLTSTFVVLQEIVLDNVATITKAKDKVLMAVVGVVLHHVPNDGTIPNVYHRLRQVLAVSDPQSQATAKKNYFHFFLSELHFLKTAPEVPELALQNGRPIAR